MRGPQSSESIQAIDVAGSHSGVRPRRDTYPNRGVIASTPVHGNMMGATMRTSASVPAASTVASRPRTRASSSNRRNIKSSRLVRAGAATEDKSHDTEVVVIGAGIGGLCAGALLAKYGKKVTVVESHDVAGGAAHSWHRDGFTFESGPSLYSGLSPSNLRSLSIYRKTASI